jgi:hypothetical protein
MKKPDFIAYFALLSLHAVMSDPRFLTLTLTMILFAIVGRSQPKDSLTPVKKEAVPGIQFSGFVDCDLFLDSRQIVNAREGQWYFYPENRKPDAEGRDINAHGSYNILSIQTRVTGTIHGPDIGKIRTSGLIEGEFYGNINPNINTFRLRHALIGLEWKKTALLAGQYWHPMYVPGASPEVVSLNAGAPFIIFTRNPQLRITTQTGHHKFIAAALVQLDAPSTGPNGPSPKYQRNSLLPEGCIQWQYGKNHPDGTEYLFGASASCLVLLPRLQTDVIVRPAYDTIINQTFVHVDTVRASYATREKTVAFSFNLFGKIRLPVVSIKSGGVIAQNSFAYNMIGGYAVKQVTDSLTGAVSYAPITTASVWCDIKTNGKIWQAGLYGGYSANLGSTSDLSGAYYSRGSNISYLYRIAPRVTCLLGKFRMAGELDYTAAAYGTTNTNGTVSDAQEVANLRLLLSFVYYF